MSFEIKIGKVKEPRNYMSKTFDSAYELTGTLKAETSILDPIILVKADNVNSYARCNYMYIAEFSRYYYINDVRSVRNDIIEIRAHVDVLYTYKDRILENNALVLRVAGKKGANVHKLLDDGCFKVYNDDHIVTETFTGEQFTSGTFILAVVGS